MANLLGCLARCKGDDSGQGLVEYVLVLVLIAIVVIIMMTGMGQTVNNSFSSVNSSMP